jgi:hypothetical protein
MSDDISPRVPPPTASDPPSGGGSFPWPGERAVPWLGTSVAAMGGVIDMS